MAEKLIVLGISGLFFFGLWINAPLTASAQTTVDSSALQGEIQRLLEIIRSLQAQIENLRRQPTLVPIPPPVVEAPLSRDFCHNFLADLRAGQKGSDASALNQVLVKEKLLSAAPAQTDTVSADAVSAFQRKYAAEVLRPLGLQNPTGFVGSYTRAKLNQLYGCGPKEVGEQPATINLPIVVSGIGYNLGAWRIGEIRDVKIVLPADNPVLTQHPDGFHLYLVREYLSGPKPGVNSSLALGTTKEINFSLALPASVARWPGTGGGYRIAVCGYDQGSSRCLSYGVSGLFAVAEQDSTIPVPPEPPAGNPTIKVLSPSGGERRVIGSFQNITWTISPESSRPTPVDISVVLYNDCVADLPGTACPQIATRIFRIARNVTGGSYNWKVGSALGDLVREGNGYRVRVCQPGIVCGQSASFTIVEATPPTVTGDANGDGSVNFADVTFIVVNWGECPSTANTLIACPGDLNNDRRVDQADVDIVYQNWPR